MFLIKNTLNGRYVAKSGHRHSYTTSLKHARKFSTREEAWGHLCVMNETIVTVEEEIGS